MDEIEYKIEPELSKRDLNDLFTSVVFSEFRGETNLYLSANYADFRR